MIRWTTHDRRLIELALTRRLPGLLKSGERIAFDGGADEREARARVVVSGGEGGERIAMEAVVDLAASGLDGAGARDHLLDTLDLLLRQYLEGGRAERLPGVFEDRELDGRPVRVRMERTFAAVDEQADTWIAAGGSSPRGQDA